MNFDTLYHRGSSGAIYSWRIWTENDQILTEYGQIDGKKQVSSKVATPKNEGKINETTAEEQAILEAKSMWKHRIDRKYRNSVEEAEKDEIFLPMLAATFEDRRNQKKEGHTYPCSIQPKLNGVRCLAYWEGDEVKLLSRGGKDYNIPHISTALQTHLPADMIFDGELYIHGQSLQTINSWVKKLRDETNLIEFHVYDCVLLSDMEAEFPERWKKAQSILALLSNLKIKTVETLPVKNEEELMEKYAEFVSKNYEGGIARMHDGSKYRFGYRSKRLLKIKDFKDDEFEVVDFKNGIGRFEKVPIWKCKAKNGNLFEVVQIGTMEEKAEILKEAKKYIGKFLTVKYQELSDEGTPIFPVGLTFRIEEDLPKK